MLSTKWHNNRGFSLIEILIVITIMGILTAIVLPRFVTSSGNAHQVAQMALRQTINAQLELYFFNTGSYPVADGSRLDSWTNDVESYWPDGIPSVDPKGEPWIVRNGRVIKKDEPLEEEASVGT